MHALQKKDIVLVSGREEYFDSVFSLICDVWYARAVYYNRAINVLKTYYYIDNGININFH